MLAVKQIQALFLGLNFALPVTHLFRGELEFVSQPRCRCRKAACVPEKLFQTLDNFDTPLESQLASRFCSWLNSVEAYTPKAK
jgi:hypothetical protein